MREKIKGGIVPDRVELGFWQLWKNYAKIGFFGIIIGFVSGTSLTAIVLLTNWFQTLLGIT